MDDVTVSAYVKAASSLLEMPLSAERHAAVSAIVQRLALLAESLTAFELSADVDLTETPGA